MASPGVIASAVARKKSAKEREMKEMKETFDNADTNCDGRLSKEELLNKLKSEGQNPSWDDVQEIIDRNDRDFDGQLCFKEFIGQETKIEIGFKSIDINNDGFVSKDEFQQICNSLSREQLQACFKRFDRNGDGKLDYREFCDLMNAHKNRKSQAQ